MANQKWLENLQIQIGMETDLTHRRPLKTNQ